MRKLYSRHIFIKTNLSCNLRCIYCYDKTKTGSIFNVGETLEKIHNILQTITPSGTKIKLVGGEPFLAFSQIKKFCETIWSMNYEEDFDIHITTNGTLVHGEIQEWLYKNRDKIICKLSLDGAKLSHNRNRSNSFDDIDIPFFARTWSDCNINMVVTPETISSFAENILFIHKCGFKTILPIFSVLTDWSKAKKETVFYEQLLLLSEYYLNNPHIQRCSTLNVKLTRILDKEFDQPLCEIGKKIVLDINSKKHFPCHLFLPSVYSNICIDNIENLDFSVRSKNEHSVCLKCPFINVCHTCYAANYIERGSFANRDMTLCKYKKISFWIVAQLEYKRIISSRANTTNDYSTMQAIKELLPTLNIIEEEIKSLYTNEK